MLTDDSLTRALELVLNTDEQTFAGLYGVEPQALAEFVTSGIDSIFTLMIERHGGDIRAAQLALGVVFLRVGIAAQFVRFQ